MKLGEYSMMVKDKTCKFCDIALPYKSLEYYDHDGGWRVEGFRSKQWLYLTCPGCGHQWSLEHLSIKKEY